MEVREILAELGFESLNDIIGRTDLLRQVGKASANLDDLDLNPLFVQADGEIIKDIVKIRLSTKSQILWIKKFG